jgi:hypothetical protein
MSDTNFTPLGATSGTTISSTNPPVIKSQDAAPFPVQLTPEPVQAPTRKAVRTTDTGYKPFIPERLRTIAYFTVGIGAPVVGLATAGADIWLDAHTAAQVAASGVAALSFIGTVAGIFGITYRPTR